jgi:hypothetical protein
MDSIITQERLMEVTGLRQKAALRRHLKRAGIVFREVNGRILTTQGALDASLVGHAKKKKEPNWGIHAVD